MERQTIKNSVLTHGSMRRRAWLTLSRAFVWCTIMVIFALAIAGSIAGCAVSINMDESRNTSLDRWDRLTPEQRNTQDDEENAPEQEEDSHDRLVHSFSVSEIGHEENISQLMGVGEVIDLYERDEVVAKISLTDVISGREARFSLNNRRAERFTIGDMIQLSEDIFAYPAEIYYHEDREVAGVIMGLVREERKSYPEYLIENRIALNRYISSHKLDNKTYEARYDISTVRVRKGERFAELYPDGRNIIDFDDTMIYRAPESNKVAWVSYSGGEEYVIEIEDFTETIIREYFWRFPSFLSTRTLCVRRLEMTEGDIKQERFRDTDIRIEVASISPRDFEVILGVEDENIRLAPGENLVHDDVVIILDTISMEEGMRAEICLA